MLLNAAAGTASPVAGADYDKLNSTGFVNLNGSQLNLKLGQAFGSNTAPTRVYTIVQGTSRMGTFAGYADGQLIQATLGSVTGTFRINYTATSVILTEIAAPTTTTLADSLTASKFQQAVTFTLRVI